jgi:hypothetical protein
MSDVLYMVIIFIFQIEAQVFLQFATIARFIQTTREQPDYGATPFNRANIQVAGPG